VSYPSAGFPDYSRLSPNGGRYLGELAAEPSTFPITQSISTTGFGYIYFLTNANGTTCDFEINVGWGGSSDPQNGFSTAFFAPNHDDFNIMIMPVIAEWFRVSYSFYRGPSTDFVTTYIYGSNALWNGPPYGGFGSQSVALAMTVPASSSAFSGMSGIVPGNAIFAVSSTTATGWYAQVQQYDPVTATWLIVAQTSGGSATNQATIAVGLIAAPARVMVFNESAAAEVFQVSLIPVP
jgi:hypothetical protein